MAAHAAPRAPLGRQLGTRSTCRSPSSLTLRAARVPARRGASRRVVALDRSREGGVGGDDGAMDTNVLYERMKALQAKEAGENNAIVEAAIEKDQAIVAGIRGDAAERPTPERTCATTRTFTRVVLHETRENIFINRASEPRKSTHQFLKKNSDPLLLKKKNTVCTTYVDERTPIFARARSRRVRRAHRAHPEHTDGGDGLRRRALRSFADESVLGAHRLTRARSRGAWR